MRIRILRIPRSARIDGIRLDQFVAGSCYDVSNTLGALLLCEGWAEPVENAPPPNLVRETYPPYLDWTPAIKFERRRWPRSR
jgi:hypothetical protein